MNPLFIRKYSAARTIFDLLKSEFAPCKAREFKTVSDSGFHATDFGFVVLDSAQFVSGTWILDSIR